MNRLAPSTDEDEGYGGTNGWLSDCLTAHNRPAHLSPSPKSLTDSNRKKTDTQIEHCGWRADFVTFWINSYGAVLEQLAAGQKYGLFYH